MARRSAPARSLPLVTLALILVNLGAYAAELASGGESFCSAYGLVPRAFARSGDMTPVFNSMFLHANLTHLAGNLIFLTIFGTVVEHALGHIRFALLYFVSGVAGALLHVAVDPSAANAMVGCSGCLFGLIALAAARNPRFLGFALTFGAVEIWHALSGTETSVSFGAHLGGLAAGVLFAIIMRATSFAKEERFA